MIIIIIKIVKKNNYDNNFLIKKLKYWGKHENNRYCTWCKKCKKNICYLRIIQEKHDYEQYCHYLQNILYKN